MVQRELTKGKTSGRGRQVALAREGAMQRTRMRQIVRMTGLSAAVFLMLSGTGVAGRSGVIAAQRSPAMNSGQPIDPRATESSPLGQTPPRTVLNEGVSPQEEQERERQMDRNRRKHAAADADKLVALSNELKADMDKSTQDELSLDVIEKAREIEKLAHDLQGRMKQ